MSDIHAVGEAVMGDDVTNRVRKIKWASLIYSCEHWEASSNHEHLWNITATAAAVVDVPAAADSRDSCIYFSW